jgi:hypothetical protein
VNKPAKPWRVTKHTSQGSLPATPFRSQTAAYKAVTSGRLGAEQGVTDDVAAVVEQWEDGRWRLYERVTYPQHPDRLARRYEEAAEAYQARPDAPGHYEAAEDAWDAMVEGVHEAEHDVDTCACRSCTLYRAATVESGQDEEA